MNVSQCSSNRLLVLFKNMQQPLLLFSSEGGGNDDGQLLLLLQVDILEVSGRGFNSRMLDVG